MEKWDYLVRYVRANILNEGVKELFHGDVSGIPKFAVETVIPELCQLGNAGWELVHMQPVAQVGSNGDVGFPLGGSGMWWSSVYFCVFKRKQKE